MSRKYVVFLFSFLLLVLFSIILYIYLKNQNLADDAKKREADRLRQEIVLKELNSFKLDSTEIKSQQEVVQELNSFKMPSTIVETNKTSADNNVNNTTEIPKIKEKPKTQAEVLKELNSFQPPPDLSKNETVNSLNDFNP